MNGVWPSDADLLELMGQHAPPEDEENRRAYFTVMSRRVSAAYPDTDINVRLLAAGGICGQLQEHLWRRQ